MTKQIGSLVVACTLLGIASACSQEQHVEVPTPLAVPFASTITDSLIAATVEYEGQVDTFFAGDFVENLDRLNELFPEVMQDDARSIPIRQEIVRQYALEWLMMAEAAERGLDPDSESIQTEINRVKSGFETQEAFLADLEEIHQTEEDLRSQIKATMTRDALIRSIEDSLQKPTVQEVETFQDEMSTRLRVQHILVGVGDEPSDETLKRSRKKAGGLLDSLNSGRPFSVLARQFSDDPGSKVSGGELPWFRKGEMVLEFEVAAFKLKEPGDYTQSPVRTPYGYHLIRLLDRRRDDVITPDSARVLLTKRRVRAAHEELQRRLVQQAVVRTNPTFLPGLPASEQSDGG